jgi:hypothetical protein
MRYLYTQHVQQLVTCIVQQHVVVVAAVVVVVAATACVIIIIVVVVAVWLLLRAVHSVPQTIQNTNKPNRTVVFVLFLPCVAAL